MIQSMTGYGKAVCELKSKKIIIEIKSLNSKQLDISTRIPGMYKEKDVEIRSLLSKYMQRGKVELYFYVENLGSDNVATINKAVFAQYKNQIQDVARENSINEPEDYFSNILRMPEVLKTELQELDEEEWKKIQETLLQAIKQIIEFRIQEGKSLGAHLYEKIENIIALHKQVEAYEEERIEKVRSRIEDNLRELKNSIDFDENRFEQEIIYLI